MAGHKNEPQPKRLKKSARDVMRMHVPASAQQLDAHRTEGEMGQADTIPRDVNGAFAPRAVTPSPRDERAVEYMLQGAGPSDALKKAGFPQSRYARGIAEVSRSKSLKVALMNRIMRMKDIPLPTADQRKDIVRLQLLTNLMLGAPKGSNAAAKLLGLDKDVAMFVSDAQQGNIVIVAPGGDVSISQSPVMGNDGPKLLHQDLPGDTD